MQLALPRVRERLSRASLSAFWREHGVALAVYALLSLALSWPTLWNLTSRVTSDGIDAKHNIWILWHTTQALLGRQPLFDAPLLYYPQGTSLLVHGVGPLTSLFALPFWPLGIEAAYNGALLVSLALTGYCMYLLARDLGFDRPVALFCGLALMASSMCLAGLASHITKVFLGLLPLILLALRRALTPGRSPWWALATALALLLTPLHTGYQFVFAAFGITFFGLAALLGAQGWPERLFVTRRLAFTALAILVVCGPLIYAIENAASGGSIGVDVNRQSFASPDGAQFLLPPHLSLLFGGVTRSVFAPYLKDVTLDIETSVSLSLCALLLCAVALAARQRPARAWALLAALCVWLACGPSLRWLGEASFTEYKLPIIGPYAFLTGLPGLDFMRAPGRWMMLGFVALAAAAGFGLQWLVARFPQWRWPILGAAMALLLLEAWPAPFPQESLPPVPAFYQQLADDPATYGVFDLPLKTADTLSYGGWGYVHTSSFYQVYQITHHKGITAGYISRTYRRPPALGDILTDLPSALSVNGHPSQVVNFEQDLARAGFRYAVLHKTLHEYTNENALPGTQAAERLLGAVYGDRAPLVDDDLVRVYKAEEDAGSLHMRAGQGWRAPELEWRWAASPAVLSVESPIAQPAMLVITPTFLYDPAAPDGLGASGVLRVEAGGYSAEVPVTANQPARVPVPLVAGDQSIALSLEAGNFSKRGPSGAMEQLSFAVQNIDLQTGERIAAPADIMVNGSPQQPGGPLLALHGDGWYEFDAATSSRWASSPAELLVYSAEEQRVTLELRATTLFNGKDGLGDAGALLLEQAGQQVTRQPLRAGVPWRADVALQPGWNRLALRLEAGNFQPSAIFPGNGDQRVLSFVLSQVDLRIGR
jgi:hypothetical protein